MSTREQQAEEQRQQQEQSLREQQERLGSPRDFQQPGEDETSTNPVIINR